MDALSSADRRGAWWQRPSVVSLCVVLLLLSAAMGWALWRGLDAEEAPAAAEGLPWQVQARADGGSEVFGLALGTATLADVQVRFPGDLHTGLIVPHGGEPALEAFVESFRAGFVTGKLVLAFDAEAGWLQRARERSPRNEVGEGGRSRRWRLASEDEAEAARQPLAALAFIPSVRLDEATVVQRFGAPVERRTGPQGELYLLYPAQGVVATLPPLGGEAMRAVIQYVAPRDFEARLRAPLRQAAASAPG